MKYIIDIPAGCSPGGCRECIQYNQCCPMETATEVKKIYFNSSEKRFLDWQGEPITGTIALYATEIK